MAIKKVVPGSLTEAYKRRQGDFSPDLVGLQFTSGVNNAFLTLGNFAVVSNTRTRVSKDYKIGEWSKLVSLNDLNLTEEQSDKLVSNQIFVKLNYNKKDLSRFVYFGNFSKFVETEIMGIIDNWPASLYITKKPINSDYELNTILSFNYDNVKNKTYFKIPQSAIENRFGLNFNDDVFGETSIENLSVSYTNYTLYYNNKEYNILEFTGVTTNSNYINIVVEGNPFTTLTNTFGRLNYHIKPNNKIINEFYNNLSEFQNTLLDRLTNPKYKAVFEVPTKSDLGTLIYTTRSFVWPTTDGYNIDIDTLAYEDYITSLFKSANEFDQTRTDLIVRRFVSESIREFDTAGDGNEETGMKVSKLLRIYGREFDEVKKYIDGISFANVVSYNKEDNTSDTLIKSMAKTLGFDVLLSTTNENYSLLEELSVDTNEPTFKGYSRNLSTKETDIELWRRLIINAWWLFKSKGTRKVLEFFLRLFGINEKLITLDEYVYIVKDKIDLNKTFNKLFELVGQESVEQNLNSYPFDDFGFPRVLQNTDSYYFQADGFWYNGGVVDNNLGNNPHFGEYDFGKRYFDKFRCFIDDFQTIETNEITREVDKNYFVDFNNGTFSPTTLGTSTIPYGENIPKYLSDDLEDNVNVLSVGVIKTEPNDITNDDYVYRITFTAGEQVLCDNDCPTDLIFDRSGVIIEDTGSELKIVDKLECCEDYYWLSTSGEFYCYWCPDRAELVEVCDSNTYLNVLNKTEDEIIKLANLWGYGADDFNGAKDYIIKLLDSYFNETKNCVIMVSSYNKTLDSETCCYNRGYNWDTENKLCVKQNLTQQIDGSITLTSTSFSDYQNLATRFYGSSCDNQNDSPQLNWVLNGFTTNDVSSYELLCEDLTTSFNFPDGSSPSGLFVHWWIKNIPKNTTTISENGTWPSGTQILQTDYQTNYNTLWTPSKPDRQNGWQGPCTIGNEEKLYRITVRAYLNNGQTIVSNELYFQVPRRF
jgi:phosphatidylethanolamine-binding protein (PEBP) family uncharacterized protein